MVLIIRMGDRQLDIVWTNPQWFTLPRHLPGRLSATDFVFFRWCGDLNPADYTVVVESLDTAGPRFRSIGQLRREVELPHVMFDWHAQIGVVPNRPSLPSFEAELVRGSTYVIPSTHGRNGRFQMERHGVHRPPGN